MYKKLKENMSKKLDKIKKTMYEQNKNVKKEIEI